jgi:phosphoglycerol transferase MdoB-like AlkP superfamily enzyme
MSSSNAPLFTNNRPLSATTDGEETALLGDTTLSPSRPLVASLLPTLYTRGLALPLATLTLLLFASHAPTFAGAIVFLSFAIARQLYVFAWYFANKIVVIHVKVTDERFKSLLEGEQGAWYQKFVALLVDGVILFGLLLTLTVVARKVAIGYYEDEWQTLATTGVVLGFVTL